MRSVFATYHPIVNFVFFCAVIGISIFALHPVFLIIGIGASITYAIMLGGRRIFRFTITFILPMIIVVMIINPLLNPRGETILFDTRYSHITMEALFFGLFAGLMLAVVLLWFSCWNRIMTSDKLIYLLGRIMPAISLVFSMVMRFVPEYKHRIRKILDAQKFIGRDTSSGSMRQRASNGMKIVSIMFTWALESSIDSADSMRSRGYGLRNRGSFSIYRFDLRDTGALVFLAILTTIVLAGAATGVCSIEFYPSIKIASKGYLSVIIYSAYALLCFYPAIVELKEIITWKYTQSKI